MDTGEIITTITEDSIAIANKLGELDLKIDTALKELKGYSVHDICAVLCQITATLIEDLIENSKEKEVLIESLNGITESYIKKEIQKLREIEDNVLH